MQIKTIKKTVSSKMTEWLETITDATLREDVKNNLLVSGGSIVSLLLNEPVNDYDIYIKDMNVLKRLSAYYIQSVGAPFEILDGRERDSLLSDVSKFAQDANVLQAVAIRTLKPDQIKLYRREGGMPFNEGKKDEELKYEVKFISPNAISLSNDIQIVTRFHGDSAAIHKTFDFIHATNYFTFSEGLVTNKQALESIITKQLRYQGSLYPVTSVIRMRKFIKRGWNIGAGEILKILFQISELDLKNPDVLEEQLIGVDIAYFGLLIDILREKPEDKEITSHYLGTIIDRVFDSIDSEA